VIHRRLSALATALALLWLAAGARLACAGSEEWSTFHVETQEGDDESILDHALTETPLAWRSEWEHSRLALRTSQGCLTSGQWFDRTDMKLATPLGKHSEFGLLLRMNEDDSQAFQYLDFQFRFHTAWGTPGAWFRPFYDKSRQDFALTWQFGADTTSQQLQLAFVLEDMFNNFWAFRQTRVGGLSEPYVQRPYEPGIRWVTRSDRVRTEVAGRWLTPSRKRVSILYGDTFSNEYLWGTIADASVDLNALGLEWRAATENQQAFSTSAPEAAPTPDDANFRRRWWVEGAAARRLLPALRAELRAQYVDRDETHGPPTGPSTFNGIDRLYTGELRWQSQPAWAARVGGMYDRISIAQGGRVLVESQGSRKESRAFIGLEAHFGNVTLSGVEGIELDTEPYEVWFVHDKGFLQLQATF